MAEADTGFVAGISRSITRTAVTANGAGAILVYLYLQFLAPGAYDLKARHGADVVSLVVMTVYLAASVVVILRLIRPLAQSSLALAEGADLDDKGRRMALALPTRVAWLTATGWAGAAVVFGFLNAALGNPAPSVGRVIIGILLGGLVTTALTATLVERAARPVFAMALAGDPEHGVRALSIRHRLVLAWVLGSAVPLLVIALTAVARTHVQREALAVPVVFLAGMGLVAGFAFTANTSAWVSEPIRELRRAVDAVRRGDLTVEVVVDDTGEIGMLEVVVNDMVRSLRDQRRIEDLFGRHVGEAVARQALEEDVALGGTQLLVSVLFVDLIGSTSLAVRRPAHEVVEVLNALFGCVVETVTAEGGWVNKFEGDGALCIFGAPGRQDDHAQRALRAARELRRRVAEASSSEPDLIAAIGVATGLAVAGNVGALDRYEYTVIGDPVNEAARVTEMAKSSSGRLLATKPAVDAAGPDESRHWRLSEEVVLRGRDVPTTVMVPEGTVLQPPATAGTIDTV